MGHAYTALLVHIIFSTKERFPFLERDLRKPLFGFMRGIVENLDAHLHTIGGVDDHVHLLADVPAKLATAEFVGKVKSNSSRWMNENYIRGSKFSWQTGYGGFSVGKSQVADVVRYIERQEEHHRKVTFQEEFVEFLKRYGISYDERYIWN